MSSQDDRTKADKALGSTKNDGEQNNSLNESEPTSRNSSVNPNDARGNNQINNSTQLSSAQQQSRLITAETSQRESPQDSIRKIVELNRDDQSFNAQHISVGSAKEPNAAAALENPASPDSLVVPGGIRAITREESNAMSETSNLGLSLVASSVAAPVFSSQADHTASIRVTSTFDNNPIAEVSAEHRNMNPIRSTETK